MKSSPAQNITEFVDLTSVKDEIKTKLKRKFRKFKKFVKLAKQRETLSRSVLTTKKSLEAKTSSKLTTKVYTVIICMLICIGLCFLIIKCCDELDPVVLNNLLNKNVFGQNEAVEHIVSALQNDNRKLLIIYGGTGVGKSYAVSLIFHNGWNSSNVFYYAMPTTKDILISNTHWGSLVCGSVIFVFDGLGSNDFDIANQIESIFAISTNQDITVVVIYNCDEVNSNFVKTCGETFRTRLIREFSAVDVAQKEFIKFVSLSQTHLRQCIDRALDGHRLEVEQYENLLNKFNVDMDGCKGVQSKVDLFKQSS